MAKQRRKASVTLLGVMRRRRGALLMSTALCATVTMVVALPARAQLATNAHPTGGAVVGGSASISQSVNTTSSQTTVNQSTQRAAINWQTFNVGSQSGVTFVQPSTSAVTLNEVQGPNPSQIAGRINTQLAGQPGAVGGQIIIENQSGVVFYKGSQVNTAGLMVSAASSSPAAVAAFINGGNLVMDQAANPNAKIVNRGQITVQQAGLAALVAPQVRNSGVITATLGHVVLASGTRTTLDLYGDQLMSIDVTGLVRTLPNGAKALVTNVGTIIADGGTVQLTARAVDGLVQTLVDAGGVIRAQSVGAQTGKIVLNGVGGSITIEGQVDATGQAPGTTGGAVTANATGNVNVASTARIDASGDSGGGVVAIGTTLKRAKGGPSVTSKHTAAGVTIANGAQIAANATRAGNGGHITVLSTGTTVMNGTISATGGPLGGNGGFVETSGETLGMLTGSVDVGAPAGSAGIWLLDPTNLFIVASGGDQDSNFTSGNGTILTGGADTSNDQLSASVLDNASGNVLLQAAQTIEVQSSFSIPAGGLTMEAGRVVLVDTGAVAAASGDIILAVNGAGPGTPPAALSNSTIGVAGSVISSGGNVSLLTGSGGNGFTLANGGLVQAASGKTVTIQTDKLQATAGGSINAPSGTIEIAPGTSGNGINFASSNAGTLQIPTSALAAMSASVLRLGAVTLNGVLTTTAGSINFDTNVNFGGVASTLDLHSTGDIVRSTDTAGNYFTLTVGTLTGSAGGNLLLAGGNSSGNVIGTVGSFSVGSGDAFQLLTNGGVTFAGLVNAGANFYEAEIGSGNIKITGSVNATTEADIYSVSSGTVGISGSLIAPTITIGTTGTLQITGSGVVGQTGGVLAVSASNGFSEVNTGTILAGTLELASGLYGLGTVSVLGTANAISNLDSISSNGDVALVSGSALTVSDTLAATGNVYLQSSNAGGITVASTGSVLPGGTSRASFQTDAFANNGTVVAGTIELAPYTSGKSISLGSGYLSSLAGMSATLFRIGAVTLPGSSLPTTTSGSITVSGPFTYAGTGTLELDSGGAIGFNNTLDLGGGLVATAGINEAGDITLGSSTSSFLKVAGLASFTNDSANSLITLGFTGATVNQLTGGVEFKTTGSAGNVAFSNDASNTVLGTSNINGSASIVATSGSISQSGVLTVTGPASFNTTVSGESIDLSTQANVLSGGVAFATTGSGNASLKNSGGTSLRGLGVGGTVSIEDTTGSISQLATKLQVTGTSSFQTDATGQTITLDDSSNAFTGAVSFKTTGSAGNVALVNPGATSIGASSIGGNLTLSTGALTLSGSINAGGSATLVSTGAIAINSPISAGSLSATAGGGNSISLNVASPTTAVQTTGAQTYNSPVVLGADTSLQGSGSSSTVDFSGAAISGAHALSISAGHVLLSSVGTSAALNSLTVSSANSHGGTSLSGNITTTGNQSFTAGTVTLSNSVTLDSSAGNGAIAFSEAVNAGAHTLTLNSGSGAQTLAGFTSSVAAALTQTTTGVMTLNAGTYTIPGSYTFGAVTVNGTLSLGMATTFGNVTLGSDATINGNNNNLIFAEIDGAHSLVVQDGSGQVTLGGVVGSNQALSSLSITSDPVIGADVTTSGGGQTYSGPISLTGPVVLTDTGGGAIALNGQVTGGTNSLKLSTSGAETLAGVTAASLSFGTTPSSLTLNGGNYTITGGVVFPAITTTLNGTLIFGAATFNGAVTLGSDTTLDSSAANGSVNFASTIDGTTAAAQSLIITAGTGTITLGGAVGGSKSLANLSANGGAIVLPSSGGVTVAGTLALASTGSGTLLALPSSLTASVVDLISQGGISQTGGAIIAGTLIGTAADTVALTQTNTIGSLGSFTVSAGDFTLVSTGSLGVTGPVTANDISLDAGTIGISGLVNAGTVLALGATTGGVDQTGASTITAATLTSVGTIGGGLTLDGAANLIGTLGPMADVGLVSIVDAEALALAGAINVGTTGTLDISTTGAAANLTQLSGSIIAGTLTSTGGIGGSVSLTAGNNQIGTLANFVTSSTLSFDDNQAVTLVGTVSGAAINLITPGVTVAGTLSDTSVLSVGATNGFIETGSGVISTPTLISNGTIAGVTLNNAANNIGTIGAFSYTGTLGLADASALTVNGAFIGGASAAGSISAVSATIASGGVLNIGTLTLTTTNGGVIETGTGSIITNSLSIATTGAGDVSLTNRNNQILASTGIQVASGNLDLVDDPTLTLTGPYSANNLFFEVTQAGDAIALGSGSTGATLSSTLGSGGRISLIADQLTDIAASSITATNGMVEIAPFSTTVAVSLAGSTQLAVDTTLLGNISTGTLVVGQFTDVNNGNAVSITAAGISVDGAVGLTGHATTLLLATNGSITESSTNAITVGTLIGTAAAAVALGNSNTIGVLGSFTAAGFALNDAIGTLTVSGPVNGGTGVGITNTGTLILAGTVTGSSAIALTGSSVAINGFVNGGTTANTTLVANGGSITESGSIFTGTLWGSATGAAALTAATNQILNIGGFSSAGFALNDATNLSINGGLGGGGLVTIVAGTITVAAGGIVSASTVDLTGPAILVQGSVIGGASGLVDLTANTGTIAIPGLVNVGTGTLDLSAGSSITETGTLIAGTLNGSSAAQTSLTGASATANQILNIGSFSSAGFVLNDGTNLSIIGGLGGGGLASIVASGVVTVGTAGVVSASTVDLTGSNILVQGSVIGGAAGLVDLTANTGTIAIPGLVNAGTGTLGLSDGSSITETGTLIAGTLVGGATGAASLTGATSSANQIANLGSFTAGTLTLNDGSSLTVIGTVSATSGTIAINTTGTLTNQSLIQATSGVITLQAATNLLNSGSVVATGNTVHATATSGTLTNNGLIQGGGDANLQAGADLNNGGSVIATNVSLNATNALNNTNIVQASANANLTAGGALTNGGSVFANGGSAALTASGGTLGNSGLVQAGTNATLQASSDLTNSGSVITQHGNASLVAVAGSLTNSGLVQAASNAMLQAATNLSNSATGRAIAQGGVATIVATSGLLSNAGLIQGNTGGTLTGSNIANTGSVVVQGGNVTLTASSGTLSNGGVVQASGNGTLTAVSGMSNSGSVFATGGSLALSVSNGTLSNSGLVQAGGNDALSATAGISNSGSVITTGGSVALTVSNGALSNSGLVRAYGSAALQASSNIINTNTGSVVTQNGSLSASATSGTISNAGLLQGATGVGLQAQNGLFNTGSIIAVGSSVMLTANNGTLFNSGLIQAPTSGGFVYLVASTGSIVQSGAGASIISGAISMNAPDGGIWLDGLVKDSPASGVRLTTGGTIYQDGTLIADLLTGSAGATVNLLGANSAANQVADLGSFTVGSGSFTLHDDAALLINGTISAATITITDLQPITLGNGTFITSGSQRPVAGVHATSNLPQPGSPGAFLTAPSVLQSGVFTVANLGGATESVLDITLSSAGAVTFSSLGLQAPDTWLVLNLGAGRANGQITVKALDVVYSAANGANLTGTINDASGSAAAGVAGILPQPNAGYRVNGCAIGSVNCVILPSEKIPQSNPINEIVLASPFIPNLEDLVLPVISDERYELNPCNDPTNQQGCAAPAPQQQH